MPTARVWIENRKIVDYTEDYLKFVSDDATVISTNDWCVQVRDGRVICDTKYDGPFESSLYHKEFYLYSNKGELVLIGGNFNERRAYFFRELPKEDAKK